MYTTGVRIGVALKIAECQSELDLVISLSVKLHELDWLTHNSRVLLSLLRSADPYVDFCTPLGLGLTLSNPQHSSTLVFIIHKTIDGAHKVSYDQFIVFRSVGVQNNLFLFSYAFQLNSNILLLKSRGY